MVFLSLNGGSSVVCAPIRIHSEGDYIRNFDLLLSLHEVVEAADSIDFELLQ
jgi:hypothetical protein